MLDWIGLPFPPPGDLPDPGIEPMSPASPTLTCGFFTTSAPWSSQDSDMHPRLLWKDVWSTSAHSLSFPRGSLLCWHSSLILTERDVRGYWSTSLGFIFFGGYLLSLSYCVQEWLASVCSQPRDRHLIRRLQCSGFAQSRDWGSQALKPCCLALNPKWWAVCPEASPIAAPCLGFLICTMAMIPVTI